MHLTILYRGPLESCNYGCQYCPFAKNPQTAAELKADRLALERFSNWIQGQSHHEFSIFFTPWGEALIHAYYQQALSQLSHLPNVRKVAIQTNLSCDLDWLSQANPKSLAFWSTFHPEWSDLDRFLDKCNRLDTLGFRYSVGVVGFAKFKSAISSLRARLPQSTYLWINAVKAELPTLESEAREFFSVIDPLYELNTHHYPTLGKACRAGNSVISVDGDGTMRRCHFIREPIGNIYDPDFETALQPRPCSQSHCHCYIGYVHLEELGLDQVYGDRILERIPITQPSP